MFNFAYNNSNISGFSKEKSEKFQEISLAPLPSTGQEITHLWLSFKDSPRQLFYGLE